MFQRQRSFCSLFAKQDETPPKSFISLFEMQDEKKQNETQNSNETNNQITQNIQNKDTNNLLKVAKLQLSNINNQNKNVKQMEPIIEIDNNTNTDNISVDPFIFHQQLFNSKTKGISDKNTTNCVNENNETKKWTSSFTEEEKSKINNSLEYGEILVSRSEIIEASKKFGYGLFINDTIVDLLLARNKLLYKGDKIIYVLSTLYATKLIGIQNSINDIKNSLSDKKASRMYISNQIYIPMYVPNHYLLLRICNIKKKVKPNKHCILIVSVFDTSQEYTEQYRNTLHDNLLELTKQIVSKAFLYSEGKNMKSPKTFGLTLEWRPIKVLQQTNGNPCGHLVIKIMEFLRKHNWKLNEEKLAQAYKVDKKNIIKYIKQHWNWFKNIALRKY